MVVDVSNFSGTMRVGDEFHELEKLHPTGVSIIPV